MGSRPSEPFVALILAFSPGVGRRVLVTAQGSVNGAGIRRRRWLGHDLLWRQYEYFELDDNAWENWKEDLIAWQATPRFTRRPELCEWLKDAPPFDCGV